MIQRVLPKGIPHVHKFILDMPNHISTVPESVRARCREAIFINSIGMNLANYDMLQYILFNFLSRLTCPR